MTNIKLYLTLPLFIIVCSSFVFAGVWTYTNTSTTLYADIYGTDWYDANATNLTIYKNDSIILNSTAMSKINNGRYYYLYNFSTAYQYYVQYEYYNSTGSKIGVSSESVSVFDNIPTKTAEEFDMILATFLLFAAGILLLVIGQYIYNEYLILAGGVWFLINTVSLAFSNQGWQSPLFFALIGLVVIYHAIGIMLDKFENKKKDRELVEYE